MNHLFGPSNKCSSSISKLCHFFIEWYPCSIHPRQMEITICRLLSSQITVVFNVSKGKCIFSRCWYFSKNMKSLTKNILCRNFSSTHFYLVGHCRIVVFGVTFFYSIFFLYNTSKMFLYSYQSTSSP